MTLEDETFEIATSDTEPGMNFISVDFELVMVNRTNERLYGKPVTALLGKKCYQEFEKRDEPCPHCPGRLALATGEPHETETIGRRDDGTRYSARIRAHPVLGPDNRPAGFIEVVEDITEQKRAESLAYIEADLQAAVVSAKTVQKVLRETLEAALRIEGLDWGCVFMIDRITGEQTLVLQRGVSPADLEILAAVSQGDPSTYAVKTLGAPPLLEVLPIFHRGKPVATLLVGASTGTNILPTVKAGLRGLGALAGNAVSRIWAEQSRGDAVADLEAFITVAPVATWILDTQGRVTMWNKAAESLFGWQASEVIGQAPPFGQAHNEAEVTVLADRQGKPLDVRLVTMPFRDVVGNASTILVMAENLTGTGTKVRAVRPAGAKRSSAAAVPVAAPGRAPRVLIVDADEPWGRELADIASALGYLPIACASATQAAALLADADREGQPFALAVVAMIYSDGSSGLDKKAALRDLGLRAPVIVSADSEVRGHEHFGITAVIRRPYDTKTVEQALRDSLAHAN